jgi:hypothetical protein
VDIVSDRCSNPASQFRVQKEATEAIADTCNGSRLTSGGSLALHISFHIGSCHLGQRNTVKSHPGEQVRYNCSTASDRGGGQSFLSLEIKKLIETRIEWII